MQRTSQSLSLKLPQLIKTKNKQKLPALRISARCKHQRLTNRTMRSVIWYLRHGYSVEPFISKFRMIPLRHINVTLENRSSYFLCRKGQTLVIMQRRNDSRFKPTHSIISRTVHPALKAEITPLSKEPTNSNKGFAKSNRLLVHLMRVSRSFNFLNFPNVWNSGGMGKRAEDADLSRECQHA